MPDGDAGVALSGVRGWGLGLMLEKMLRSGYVAHMCSGFGVEGLGLRVLPIETFGSRTARLESRRLLDYLTQGSSCVDFWLTQLKACHHSEGYMEQGIPGLPGTREPRAGYVPEGRELAALFPGNGGREHVEPWALLTLSLDPFLARERSAHQAEG